MAVWIGANPEEVRVTPNLDFSEDSFNAQQALNLMQAKIQGLPLSARTIHTKLRDQDYTDLTFEDEIVQLQVEKDQGIPELLSPATPIVEEIDEEPDEEVDEEIDE